MAGCCAISPTRSAAGWPATTRCSPAPAPARGFLRAAGHPRSRRPGGGPDIKGENFAVTRRYRQSLGRRVAVLNPFGVIEPSRDRFNPLDYLRPEHLGRDAALLADGLIRPEPGAESHFTDIARTLLTAALEVTAATAAPAHRTLPTVADRLLGPTALEELKAWAAQPGLCGGRPAQAAAAVLRAGDREQGSFFTTLACNLDWLASDPMREVLSRSDVDLEDLLDDRLDLYLVVPLDLVAQQANFLRLVTSLVLGTVIRQDGRRQLRQRLLLVLDEFTRLGPMTQLMNIATVAAGSGIEALFVAQDKGSLDAVWGPAGAGTLLGSCATVRVFGLGRTDGVTAQWAEQQLGHRTLYSHSRRTGGLGAVGAHDGQRSEVRDRLLTAAQIQELPPERMLCFLRAHPPLVLDRLLSHRHPADRDRLDPNPTRRA